MRHQLAICSLAFLLISGCGGPTTPSGVPDTIVTNKEVWLSDKDVVENTLASKIEEFIKNNEEVIKENPGGDNSVAVTAIAKLRSENSNPDVQHCLDKVADEIAPYHVGQWAAKYQKDASTLSDGEMRALSRGMDILQGKIEKCALIPF